MTSTRTFANCLRSAEQELLADNWSPNGLAVRQARAHLQSLSPERRAQLEAEWEQPVEYV